MNSKTISRRLFLGYAAVSTPVLAAGQASASINAAEPVVVDPMVRLQEIADEARAILTALNPDHRISELFLTGKAIGVMAFPNPVQFVGNGVYELFHEDGRWRVSRNKKRSARPYMAVSIDKPKNKWGDPDRRWFTDDDIKRVLARHVS